MYQSKQGQPLAQTKINESQQEPELHPHDSCARVAPEDRLKHSQPQSRNKENDVMSNLTEYVKNVEEKEPVKGLHGSGVRVALEDSIRRYANEPEREPERRAAPRPETEQGEDLMSHLTGFIQNIDEDEPVKGLYGSGVRVHDEDRWKYRAQPEGVDVGSMSTNITGSNINIDENEPGEEVRRGGRTAPGENPPHEPGRNPVMQTLSGFIRNVDEGEPIKGIYGAGVRADEEDRWQTFAEPTQQEEEETVRRAGRANTVPLTRNVDENDMWKSTGRRVTKFEQVLDGYMSRQFYQEWHRERNEEPIKGPDGNCARVDPQDRLRHSYTTPAGCNWAV